MSITTKQEGENVRVTTDRAGERATSALLSREEATAHLEQLAGYLGYSLQSTGQYPPPPGTPAEVAVEDTTPTTDAA